MLALTHGGSLHHGLSRKGRGAPLFRLPRNGGALGLSRKTWRFAHAFPYAFGMKNAATVFCILALVVCLVALAFASQPHDCHEGALDFLLCSSG
jgi:hypothetical protein